MRSLSDIKFCFLAGTLGQGGAERQLYFILKSLRNANADVTLLSLTEGEYWEEPIKQLGIPIRYVGGPASRVARCAKIAGVVREIRPDIVHSQHFYTNLYAVAAARWALCREVGSLRSDVIHEISAHSRALGTASLRLPRMLAVNSQCGRENAMRLGVRASRLQLLPNAVEMNGSGNLARREATTLATCFVGRLTPLKRGDVFLRALAAARPALRQPITATIVGDGPDRARLEEVVRELELPGHTVRFAGAVADPTAYYHQADVAVLTSDWEGTPNVILEAMAAGLPVVATAVGGVADLVRHGETGLLAPAGDVNALAGHLRTLAADPDMRRALGDNARRVVAAEYSFDALSGNLQRLYNAALAQ